MLQPGETSPSELHALNRPDLDGELQGRELPLRRFNYEVKELLKMLRRNKDKDRFDKLKKTDQKALVMCDELIDLFLWKVCLHETHQIELAATAVTQTRRELFALLNESVNGNALRRLFSKGTLWCLRPNVWLFMRVQKNLNELQTDMGPLLTSLRHDRMGVPKFLERDPDGLRVRLQGTCALRQLRRKPHPDRHGKTHEPDDWNPEKFCRRACDLLLMTELCLRLQEMSQVVGLSTATIHKKIMDYSAAWKSNLTKSSATPAVTRLSTTHNQ